jgi:hypothetical protein
MSRQLTIETPFPSLAETAHILGVSPAAAMRVQRMVSERKPRKRSRTTNSGAGERSGIFGKPGAELVWSSPAFGMLSAQ